VVISARDYQAIKLAVMGAMKKRISGRNSATALTRSWDSTRLDEKNIHSIARIQLQYLESRLAKLETEIAQAGFDPVYGARPLKRAIQGQIENPLIKEILEGRSGPKSTIIVDNRNGGIVFSKS
jgi:ATP-dependent Clp protease ATP-binding subunit ClpB